MTFEYVWLRILQALAHARRPMDLAELRAAMARRGFRVDAVELEKGVERLRDQGLVETLVLANGETQAVASVAITQKGERKVRGIVRF